MRCIQTVDPPPHPILSVPIAFERSSVAYCDRIAGANLKQMKCIQKVVNYTIVAGHICLVRAHATRSVALLIQNRERETRCVHTHTPNIHTTYTKTHRWLAHVYGFRQRFPTTTSHVRVLACANSVRPINVQCVRCVNKTTALQLHSVRTRVISHM